MWHRSAALRERKSTPTIHSMSRPTVNQRLFVAAYPPHHLAEAWLATLTRLPLPEHRAVPVDQVHLTLQFIGDTPAKELDTVIESVERACAGLSQCVLTPREWIALPERGPARLVAVETDAPPALLELQRRLARRLATNVKANPTKGFRPHLTLCRFRSPAVLNAPLPELAQPASMPFSVSQVVLMRSVLRPDGAEHVPVHSWELAVRRET